jgi:hypothetical protein
MYSKLAAHPDSEEEIVWSHAFQAALHLVSLIAKKGSVNCVAIPGLLSESELFGPERSAFTGALSKTKRAIRNWVGSWRAIRIGLRMRQEKGDICVV